MNGTIVQVLVEPGQLVKAGDTLLIMEAMKMEHAIQADTDGEVTEVYYQTGDLVDGGASLLQFEPASGESA
jgi:3-methylcrotonyl-CoA carboxylase alpha subunit